MKQKKEGNRKKDKEKLKKTEKPEKSGRKEQWNAGEDQGETGAASP